MDIPAPLTRAACERMRGNVQMIRDAGDGLLADLLETLLADRALVAAVRDENAALVERVQWLETVQQAQAEELALLRADPRLEPFDNGTLEMWTPVGSRLDRTA